MARVTLQARRGTNTKAFDTEKDDIAYLLAHGWRKPVKEKKAKAEEKAPPVEKAKAEEKAK